LLKTYNKEYYQVYINSFLISNRNRTQTYVLEDGKIALTGGKEIIKNLNQKQKKNKKNS